MAYQAHARVWETPVTVTGTGSITLPGTAATGGYRTFDAAFTTGDTCPYLIHDTVTGAWEAGTGTVTIATGVATLARTTVLESTNANALVSFAGNACDVQVDYPPSTLDLTNPGLLNVSNVYTASGAIAVTDVVALINAASAVTMTLAAGSTDGHELIVKRYGAGAVTLTGTIDGAAATIELANPSVQEAVDLAWNASHATWLLI